MPNTEAPETPSPLSGKHSPARTGRIMHTAGRALRITLLFSATWMSTTCGEDASAPSTPDSPSTPSTPPNRAPRVVREIEDFQLPAPLPRARRFDITDHFSDPDGDRLSFSAASSDVDVVYVGSPAPTIDANGRFRYFFTVSGQSPGTATVTVTATDPGGLSASFSFRVTAGGGDDHGNNRDSSTRVSVPSTTRGFLETTSDVDVFRFGLPSSGRLTIYTTGDTDTIGEVEMVFPEFGSRRDENSGEDQNFRIVVNDAPAGSYYVRVWGYRGSNGPYQLHVEAEGVSPPPPPPPPPSRDDHGDDRESATSVGTPSDTSGTLTSRDTDYFRISVSGSGTLAVYTSGSLDTIGQLENSAGSRLASDDDSGSGGNFRIERNVSRGTYYIRVRGFSNTTAGNYRLHVRFGEDSVDDHGDHRSGATRIDVPSDTSGRLTAGDTDYFRISLRDSGTLVVYTSGSLDTVGQLEDSGGSRLTGNDDGGSGTNFRIERDVSGGTYYIRVTGISSSTTGNYTLHVRFEEDSFDDHGDRRSDATRIDVPSDTSGRLTAGDTDYFRISLRDSGTLEVYTSGSLDTVGQLEDSGGSRLTGNDDGGSGTNFRIERDVSGGTYYIRVTGISSSTTGNYRLHVRFEEDSFDDHGDRRSDATRIDVPSDTSGRLTAGDTDYFRISLRDSGTLEVYTSGSLDTVGQLEDSNGSRLASNDDSGSGNNFRIERDVSGGTYYIRVRGYSDSTTGAYRLHVRFVRDEYPPRLTGVYWEVTTPPDYFISESEVRCGQDGIGRPGPGVYISWDLYPEAEYFDLHTRSRDDRDPDWRDVGAFDGEGFLVDPNREEVCYERWGFSSPIRVDLRLRAVLYDGSMSEWHTILNIPLPANPLAAAKVQGTEKSEGVGHRVRAGRPR